MNLSNYGPSTIVILQPVIPKSPNVKQEVSINMSRPGPWSLLIFFAIDTMGSVFGSNLNVPAGRLGLQRLFHWRST